MTNMNDENYAKGGSWLSYAGFCRSAFRCWGLRDNSYDLRGFRIVIKALTITITTTTNPSALSFDFLPEFKGIPHPSEFPGAYMGDTPITQEQYQTIVEMFPECGLDPDPSMFKGADRPVECVTYEEVTRWLELLNQKFKDEGLPYEASLPTEEEWMAWAGDGEYATATGKIGPELAWYDKSPDSGTAPVKSFPPNLLGMYDMAGNVYEFISFHS